jgi:dienelactone hydrolase
LGTCSRGLLGAVALCGFVASSSAPANLWLEQVSIAIASPFDPRAAVVGSLRIPAADGEPLPAVVIVNSTNGFDGRGAFYAEALNHAGIATFEIDMFQGRGTPASVEHDMPGVYQALRFLARHPRIDGGRIGIMGFSYGAQIALLASFDEMARTYGEGRARFAAYLPFYPQCWRLLRRFQPDWSSMQATGQPVHILMGRRDDYDSLEGCRVFLARLSAPASVHYEMSVYENATFAWDSRFSSAVYEAGANRLRGGIVHVEADADIARQSREFAVTYFSRHLAPR